MSETRERLKQLEVMVAGVFQETPDTVTLTLFTGNDNLNYSPGNFLTIEPHQFPGLRRWVEFLQDLKQRKEPPRAYSLSSSPDEKYIAITVKEERYQSGVTPYPPLLSPILAHRTPVGTKMVVTGFAGPYTLTPAISSENREAVHICAGSGIVPSYSIIKHDLRTNTKLKHTLIYSNKLSNDIIFHRQITELEKEFPERLKVVHTLTREQDVNSLPGDVRKGRLSADLIREFVGDISEKAFFVCGPDHSAWQKKKAKESGTELPPSFLRSVLDNLESMGVPKEKITRESYG